MQGIIVSDTNCLILLDKIHKIDLLKTIFGKIVVTTVVAKEFGKELPDFVSIQDPHNKKYVKLLENSLDPGEASAIALAFENEESLLIIDEYKGRREAFHLGLKYTGSLGIFIVAKEMGIINSFTEIIEEVNKTNFRLSKNLIEEVKRRLNE